MQAHTLVPAVCCGATYLQMTLGPAHFSAMCMVLHAACPLDVRETHSVAIETHLIEGLDANTKPGHSHPHEVLQPCEVKGAWVCFHGDFRIRGDAHMRMQSFKNALQVTGWYQRWRASAKKHRLQRLCVKGLLASDLLAEFRCVLCK